MRRGAGDAAAAAVSLAALMGGAMSARVSQSPSAGRPLR